MKYILILFMLISLKSLAQPGIPRFTPPGNLIPLAEKKVIVPERFKNLTDTNRVLRVPTDYQPQVFWVGNLVKPRMLRLGFIQGNPYTQLFVTDMVNNGGIYRFQISSTNQYGDSLIPVVLGVKANDFRFWGYSLFVAEETRILKFEDWNDDGYYEAQQVLIPNLMEGADFPSGGHSTRSIEIVNNKLYVSIGSYCNACRESNRAVILEYNLDGSGRRVYASGIRNAVGLCEKDGKLIANNNGSDWLGNDLPGEWIDEIRDGGFYGYPYAFGNQVWVDLEGHSDYRNLKPITASDSAKVASMQQPLALIQAHSAPMALEYVPQLEVQKGLAQFTYSGFLCVLRGSWNRSPATGYKVVFLHQPKPDSLIESVSDFVSGFLTDSLTGKHWGRPVGLAIARYADASTHYFLSLDAPQGMILHLIDQSPQVGLSRVDKESSWVSYPNPFSNQLLVEWKGSSPAVLRLINLEGKELLKQPVNLGLNELVTEKLPAGMYLIELKTPEHTLYKRIIKQTQ